MQKKVPCSLGEKHQALLAGLDPNAAERFASFLFTVPREAGKAPSLRTLAIGLYDPWCDRRDFPMGIIFQAAPYSCCSHKCRFCYGRSYLPGFERGGRAKKNYRQAFDRCLERMRELDLPGRHLSLANSTDVLQSPLEHQERHTLYMLRRLRENPGRFSSIGLLTRNPSVLLEDPDYVATILASRVVVQVSIAFFRDEMAQSLEPGAPPVSRRRDAVDRLVQKGVVVELRLDPIFPRDVPGIREYQSMDEDLLPLARWATATGIKTVVSKPLELPAMGARDMELHESLRAAFPSRQGSYWRMPPVLQHTLVNQMAHLCAENGLAFEHCLHNILKRNRN